MKKAFGILFALCLPAAALTVAVDPAGTFTGSWTQEWNTAGSLDGWTLTQATATVANGILQGTATGTDSRVILSNFASGPDLDLGYSDFLELRIQVPASYAGAIQIFYGTTSYTVNTAAGGTATAATTGLDLEHVARHPAQPRGGLAVLHQGARLP